MTDFDSPNNQKLIKKIGRRIFVLRQSKGLSREDLAFKIGISHQQLFKYEMGQNRITVDRLIDIASALDLKLLNFFPVSEFGDEIGNLSAPQNIKEIRLAANFARFKNLSGEDVAIRFLELLVND